MNISFLLELYKTDIIVKELYVSLTTLKSKIEELVFKRQQGIKKKLTNEKLFKELVKLGALNTDIHILISTVLKRKKQV